MLGEFLGSVNKERVLAFIVSRRSGYAREVSRFYGVTLRPIQEAMDGLEVAGVLVSHNVGQARVYEMNPRHPALSEIKALVERAVSLYPPALHDRLIVVRSRPRRKGKPA